ncbi:hypothetical protein PRIPAC_80076 [Pristionchus pacificus]|uniref:Uncharacterized protein n=1 Tax=Pristionchus pacificus TaxID=54126 RepID=A0A2A6BZ05_PRIPA|nr:hypothetical protein PRIPAC_80076 [Pristionchus pacificus]|eukprot:PDM71001.1 hypothetical protein PRIPAC_44397 [Pristionchus pacificus]
MIPQRGRMLFRNSYLLHSILRPQTTAALSSPISNHIKSWVDAYEEFIGVSAVKDAQSQVMKWEERLSDAQLLRRDKQAELKNIQGRLKEIHFDLDRTSRGEDKYLELLTEEHATIKRERALLETFESYESAEREAFHQLSIKVRESHEKERERVEKTKWWGVSASLIGALLGIAGSSIGNTMRMKKIKELLPASQDDLKEVIVSAKEQEEVLRELLIGLSGVMDGKEMKVKNKDNLMEGMSNEKVLSLIREENARLVQEISEYTKKMKVERAMDDSEAVVYVGSEMERLLEQTEKNMESKMKLQTLLSVVFLYSALGLTVPVLWALFGR